MLHAIKNIFITVLLLIITAIVVTVFHWTAEAGEMQEYCDETQDCVVTFNDQPID